MDLMNSPRLARGILRLFLPRETRDAVTGDLEEGFARAASPRAWYWKQVMRSIAPSIGMRWRSPGVLRIGVAAVLSYLVLAACVIGLEAAISPFVDAPTLPYILLNLLVGTIGAISAGSVIAVMVPMAPMKAVKIFAGFLGVMALISFAVEFGRAPLWYQIVLLCLGPSAAYLGGRLTSGRRIASGA